MNNLPTYRWGESQYACAVFWTFSGLPSRCMFLWSCHELTVLLLKKLIKVNILFFFFFSPSLKRCGLLSAFPEGWSSSEVQWGEQTAPGIKTASAHRKEKREGKACYPADPCCAKPLVWKSMAAQQLQGTDRTAHHWDRLEVGAQ